MSTVKVTDGDFDAQLPRRDQVAGDPVDGWLVHAGCVRAGKILAGKLDHHATIDRLSHFSDRFRLRARPERRERAAEVCGNYFLPLAAATSAAKSLSCFSIPSPRA